jgi:hypothetical protein
MTIESRRVLLWVIVCSTCAVASAADWSVLRGDRAAIERVYYNHRLGNKPPFDQVLPPATLDNLVRLDLRKEAVLARVYGVEITPAMLDAEVGRINTTTRAPAMLAEVKSALHDDAARFANSFAKPILVERLLREKFNNDDALHAPLRRQVEEVRNDLLEARSKGARYADLLSNLKRRHPADVIETSWQLGIRAADTTPAPAADDVDIRKRFGPSAQILSPRHSAESVKTRYWEDLPPQLQNVLQAQLRQPADVSAGIETPDAFLLYIAKDKTAAALSVAALSLPKLTYEAWLHRETLK